MYENEFTSLIEISESLSANSDDNERLNRLVEILEKLMDMRRITLLLTNSSENYLSVEGHAGEASEVQNIKATYCKGEGIIGKVLESEEPVLVPKIADEPDFQSRIHDRRRGDEKKYAFVCVPIKNGKTTVGALAADIPLENGDSGECKTIVELEGIKGFFIVVASIISHDVRLRRLANLRSSSLLQENLRLQSLIGELNTAEMIGNSAGMRDVYVKIAQIGRAETTALIRGESGTGKELVASAIHYASNRKKRPFVKVNCAALSEGVLESELFGHEKGAFTGALQQRKGRVEEAEGGTLFLDEIGEFSLTTQVKLLRLLQEKEYSVVGSNEVKNADVRFICATNRDLEKAVENDGFRSDLYYRINVFPIYLPPLRERKDDILPLANYFVEKYSKSMGKTIRRISSTAIEMLVSYHWPGNIRELENCIQHGILVSSGEVIQGGDLPPSLAMPEKVELKLNGNLTERVEQLEKDMITDALKATGGNVSAAARELGITARMARYKIAKFNLRVEHIADEFK